MFKEIEDWNLDRREFKDSLNHYEKLVKAFFPEEKEYLQNIKTSSQNILQISENLVKTEESSKNNFDIVSKQTSLENANKKFNEIIKNALQHEDAELTERNISLSNALNQDKKIIFIVTFSGLFLALLIAFLISKSILNTIELLQKSALEMGKGDLNVRIKTSAKDELGVLANAFN